MKRPSRATSFFVTSGRVPNVSNPTTRFSVPTYGKCIDYMYEGGRVHTWRENVDQFEPLHEASAFEYAAFYDVAGNIDRFPKQVGTCEKFAKAVDVARATQEVVSVPQLCLLF